MHPPSLNFEFRWMPWEHEIPNGCRWATVEEVRTHFNTLARLGLPPLHPQQGSIDGGRRMYLLDGYMTYPSNDHFEIRQTYEPLIWKVVAKKKVSYEEADPWSSKTSAVLLRKELYADIPPLSQQGRQTALLNACWCYETEVVYWLLRTTSSEELERFKIAFNKQFFSQAISTPYLRMVECLLSKDFPFEQARELDSDGNNLIHYAIEMTELAKHNFPNKNTIIYVVELLVEFFSAEIVHLKDSYGMSFLDKAEKEADDGLITLFTKLLAVSNSYGLENHFVRIKPRFPAVLLEAFWRWYVPLLEKLLDFIEKMTIDVALLIRVLSESDEVDRRHASLVEKLLEFKVHEQINRDEFAEVLKQGTSKVRREWALKLSSKVEGKLVMQVDTNEKTLIHYAAESGEGQVFHILVQQLQSHRSNQGGEEESQNIVKNRDKFGRSILHWASFIGEAKSCEICVKEWELQVETKDSSGQNSLHLAGRGILGHKVVDLLINFSSRELIYSTDYKGKTPLHLAAAVGNIQMVEKLLDLVGDSPSQLKYIKHSDSFGRTALHMAVRGGHQVLVQFLLRRGSEPLQERDMHGQTSLHYATQVEDPKVAVALSRRLLDKYGSHSEERSLLIWASAAGIGTADENEQTHLYVRTFLEEEKTSDKTHLLRAAAVRNNEQMAWELVNRRAKLGDIYDDSWRYDLSTDKKKNVENVIKQIELANKRGHDKPSLEDNLGRSTFAEGLAALFLNKFIESPITVGISGDWGMGKSSLMFQTEQILLMAASQLTFPNLLMLEKFQGVEEISLNNKGVHIYQNFNKGVGKLLGQGEKKSRQNPLVNLLKNYQPQYHEIYKSIACMDQNQMLKLKPNRSTIQSQSYVLRGVPRILTIQYNAWHYRNEQEAWAGLAVRISESIEKSMTRAQWFTTLWKYTWNLQRMTICLQVFMPCLFAAFVACWVAWGAWVLLDKGKIKELKFGSIPCTVVAIVWVVLKSIISVVQPVSVQMMGYITKPDHSNSLGYQQKVISDIKFLKNEIGRKPGWFFSFISGEWCWNWFGLSPDNIENTCIPKFQPASEDELRIITFVDDLDRCEEKVILQVLSAINLVLAECKINVILGMDKKMIERAIKRNFHDNDDQNLADRFICKIIQIPLSLPDPVEEEVNNFLENQLGYPPATITPTQDGGETDYGEIEADAEENVIESGLQANVKRNTQASAVLDICCSSGKQTSCQGIIKELLNCWWKCLTFLYLFVCNVLRKLWHFEYKSNQEKIHPLTFSKGVRLSREMLLSNYSREEANIFYELKGFATHNQKLPREWKRLLNYHKLACNILSRQEKVYSLPGWKEQLVAWLFVCWQWKHEMNTLFKDWHKYAVVSSTEPTGDEVENHERWHGPSLKTIVTNYIRRDGDDITSVKKDESYYQRWLNLRAALDKQDVTMKGIQLFQQFRLHCETCHLPWPLPQLNQRASSFEYMEA